MMEDEKLNRIVSDEDAIGTILTICKKYEVVPNKENLDMEKNETRHQEMKRTNEKLKIIVRSAIKRYKIINKKDVLTWADVIKISNALTAGKNEKKYNADRCYNSYRKNYSEGKDRE